MKMKMFLGAAAAFLLISMTGCGLDSNTNGAATNGLVNSASTQKVVIALKPDKIRIKY
ncbi:MAG: hypothetical protein KBF52_15075 [Pyrinomonadaceae bacterium]|nr:hypothetical protein [Pyrinomonadaceae bacterium]MBP9937087.1 hypothetical protein [Pyrinomonadaceae bacterium]